jgi:hypothetical protein
MRGHQMKRTAYVIGFCVAFVPTTDAFSAKDITPFLPRVTIGVPAGTLPLLGLYFSTSNATFDLHAKNDQDRNS